MLTVQNQEKRFRQNLFVAVCLCAVSTASIAAQSLNPTGNVVPVRNARAADFERDRLFEAMILVSVGKPKSPEVEAAIALAAGELYPTSSTDYLSFRFSVGNFGNSNDLGSGLFKRKITGNTKDNLTPLCKDEAASRANIDFVACATKRGGAAFVPVYDRIADFRER